MENNIAVSTFSGCGGSSEGLKQAGWDVVWANEFVAAASETYCANHKNTFMCTDDIRGITAQQIFDQAKIKKINLFEGSPPCASFSMSGGREKLWGKEKKYSDRFQRTDDLAYIWVDLALSTEADSLLMENVKGLTIGSAKNYLINIVNTIRSRGYKVRVIVADATYFGVSQQRPRTYIVASKIFDPEKIVLKKIPYETPKQLFSDLKTIVFNNKNKPSIITDNHAVLLEGYKISEYAKELGWGEAHKKRFNLVRMHPLRPAQTIVATVSNTGASSVFYWDAPDRKFSVNELKKLFGFPDNYVFTGTYEQRLERLGRSVCPPVYKHIGKEILRLSNG